MAEFVYGPHEHYTEPVFVNNGEPVCPACLKEFILNNVPTMKRVDK